MGSYYSIPEAIFYLLKGDYRGVNMLDLKTLVKLCGR